MKRYAVPVLLLLSAPVAAQETDAPSLMERGAQMFLEGLMQEVEPGLQELRDLAKEFGPAMQGFLSEMGPSLGKLLEEVQDWSAYHPPEILPNGDIILRRKEDRRPETTPDGSIEL